MLPCIPTLLRSDIGKYGTNAYHRISKATGPDHPFPFDDPPLAITVGPQTIAYTSFHQPASLSETIGGTSYLLEYTYDADQQRNYSKLRNMTTQSTVEERWYENGLETQRLNGNPSTDRKILYVEGGDGLCALIVAEPGGAQTAYAIYKDHLGSIVAVTKHTFSPELLGGGNSGPPEIMAEQNFDAWGRRRNPDTWLYTSVPNPPAWLYRGYTGHEHLEPFALINMNGRLYDPLNGRMLSADNYVQGGLGTQGYNRYSYAGNNPLKYTDPSGENPVVVAALIGGAIFGYLGGSGANGGEWNPGKWDYNSGKTWAGIGIGAVVGAGAGIGAMHAGMALSGTGLFSAFTNGSVAAFGLSMGTAGAVAGYATGFGVGLMNSNWDTHIANQVGGYYAGIGAAIGSVAGLIYGNTEQGRSYMVHGRELLQASLEGGGITYTHPNGINWGQAWWHYQHGYGAPLSTPLSTIDLSGIGSSDFSLTQPYTEFNLLGGYGSNLSDNMVYGTLALSLSNDRSSVHSYLGFEMYDFNMRPWKGYFWRNIATVIGHAIHTPGGTIGVPFPILLFGTAPINP